MNDKIMAFCDLCPLNVIVTPNAAAYTYSGEW